MKKGTQQIVAFSFGILFVGIILVLAISRPNITPFQYLVFRVVLALAAGGIAAMIPGFFQLQVSKWLRAGGALAVFAVVYFYNPALLDRSLEPPLEAAVTLESGTYDAVELIDMLSRLTGNIVLQPPLRADIAGRKVAMPPLKDVSLKLALDQIFASLSIAATYETEGRTVVIRRNGK
jgi:hypothetical protein